MLNHYLSYHDLDIGTRGKTQSYIVYNIQYVRLDILLYRM